MADDERQQVLKMIEDGKISAEQGLTLIQALEENAPDGDEPTPEVVTSTVDPKVEAEFTHKIDRLRKLWTIPMWVGVIVTVLAAYWMYTSFQAGGLGFWLFVALVVFFLGVGILAFAFGSRTSKWLSVDIKQKPGESPQRIAFSVPLPLGLVHWGMPIFGNHIPNDDRRHTDDILHAVFESTSSTAPVFIDVHDEDGEHVQIYIG